MYQYVSTPFMLETLGGLLQSMKSPKKDYEILKQVASEPGTREDLLIFLSFNTLVIHHVLLSRSNECTSNE